MTDDEWKALAMLLDKGFKWREPFVGAVEDTYQILLDGYKPAQIAAAITALVAGGQVFGPTPGELVAQMRSDPSRPTFAEVFELIYARGGIIRARPEQRWFDTPADKAHAEHEARVQRCREVHPWVGDFAVRYGLDRLYHLPINDPEYGDAKRRELERAWGEYCETAAGREIAAIAAGVGRTNGGLSKLDPLSVLPGHAPKPAQVPELGPGT